MNTKKTRKPAARKPKYTRLSWGHVGRVVVRASDFVPAKLAKHIHNTFEVEECEDAPGTFFVSYQARTLSDAVRYAAAMGVAAAQLGFIAKPGATWDDELEDEDKTRYVDVWLSAANYYDKSGKPKA